MAMTPESRDPGEHPAEPDLSVVDDAAAALRSYTDQSWTGASRRILGHVLTATRRSRPVRGRAASGPFHVSDQVLTTRLQAAVDAIDDAELTSVLLDLDGDRLASATLGVTVRYPQPVHPLAALVRAAAIRTLADVLGVAEPVPPARLTVHITDVDPP